MLTREQVELLHGWGAGIEQSGSSEELRAAGRAIRLLVEYIEAIERGRWHERVGINDRIEDEDPGEPDQTVDQRSILGALARRIGSQL